MKKYFALIVFIVLLPIVAGAQSATRAYVPGLPGTEAVIVPDPVLPFGTDRINWETNLSTTFTDIITAGRADTSMGDSLIYYGHPIPTSRMIGLPRVALAGKDSATVYVDRRQLVLGSNRHFIAGPWTAVGSAIMTNPREYTAGAGGGTDSLAVLSQDPVIPDTERYDPGLVNTESGYIQHRYTVVSDKAKKSTAVNVDIMQPAATQNYFWLGEALITVRRDAR